MQFIFIEWMNEWSYWMNEWRVLGTSLRVIFHFYTTILSLLKSLKFMSYLFYFFLLSPRVQAHIFLNLWISWRMSCTKSWYILDAYWKCAWILSCLLHLTHNIKTGVQFIKSEISYHCYEEASPNARMQRPRPGCSSASGGQCIRQAPPLPG